MGQNSEACHQRNNLAVTSCLNPCGESNYFTQKDTSGPLFPLVGGRTSHEFLLTVFLFAVKEPDWNPRR